MLLQQLFEGVSSVLYHYTTMHNISEILKSDTIRLTPDMSASAETDHRSKGKIHYLSTARSVTSGYFSPISKHQKQAVIIVLDGRKLMSAGYTGNAIDYWGPEFRALGKDEMEDRIFSHAPTISNASKYITEVHVLFDYEKGSGDHDRHSKTVRNILYRAKHNNIAGYMYSDQQAFNHLNKAKSLPLSHIEGPSDKKQLPGVDMGDDYYPPYNSGPTRNYFAPYIEMLNVADEGKLSPATKKELYNLHYSDKASSISSDMHNARSGRNRSHLDKLLVQMKKYKLTSVQQMIDYLNDKFKDS